MDNSYNKFDEIIMALGNDENIDISSDILFVASSIFLKRDFVNKCDIYIIYYFVLVA